MAKTFREPEKGMSSANQQDRQSSKFVWKFSTVFHGGEKVALSLSSLRIHVVRKKEPRESKG
jgi:hypothetical protein